MRTGSQKRAPDGSGRSFVLCFGVDPARQLRRSPERPASLFFYVSSGAVYEPATSSITRAQAQSDPARYYAGT